VKLGGATYLVKRLKQQLRMFGLNVDSEALRRVADDCGEPARRQWRDNDAMDESIDPYADT